MADSETAEGYQPPAEFEEDSNGALIDLPMTGSTELWLLRLPYSKDFLSDIHGKELPVNLQNDGKLAWFESSSGKRYDFVSYACQEPAETVFIPSATDPIIGKVSRRVSTVHYSDPKELEKLSATSAGKVHRNSAGATGTTSSRYFPMRSGRSSQSGRAASSKGSRQKSTVSEVTDPSSKRVSKSTASEDISSGSHVPESSHGHSTGISSMSSDQSHGAKSKRRKHKE
ncbi:mediator-associated protein 2 [Lotus japonicus]|uniref:mediator-associated protein 2 n=1 Tax=Lotus japonicus TaxID=34305 RepID=UPI002587A228|nr:mediator-associated protein 2 [Lotus japonicus]